MTPLIDNKLQPEIVTYSYSYLVLKGYLQQQDPYECHQSKMVPTHLLYLEYQI